MGIVIGEMAGSARGCTIYQGVTLGGTSLVKGAKRHPTLGPGVIVGANACVLGGFTVGAGARIGSAGAVVTKPVPAGATAVGNPARIIEAQSDQAREEAAARMGFSACGITQGDDPVAMAMRGLIDSAASQDHQIAMLWQAPNCPPSSASRWATVCPSMPSATKPSTRRASASSSSKRLGQVGW